MSGCYQQENLDAPGGINDTMAQVRDGLAAADAALAAQQATAREFIASHGSQVVGGHSPVGAVAPHDVGQQAS